MIHIPVSMIGTALPAGDMSGVALAAGIFEQPAASAVPLTISLATIDKEHTQ